MLAKNYRVPRENIDYILEKGESFKTRLFIVRFKKNHTQNLRFRVIISKKVDLKAVKRNRLRRQIYEAIRTNLQTENIKEGLDLILIAKKSTINADFTAINQDIKECIINRNYGKI